MGMRINTNVASLNAQRRLFETQSDLGRNYEKLASGSRINRAQDDAAGLSISENLKAQLRGLKQAQRNANDGISIIQVAEGAVNEVSNMLIRLRELGVQASSDTIGADERKFLDVEFQSLKNEIQRIAETTKFNGTRLLDGSGQTLEIQVGLYNDDFQDRITLDTGKNNTQLETMNLSDDSITDKKTAQGTLDKIDSAILFVNEVRANYGGLQNRLESVQRNIANFHENLSAANSRIRDADIAEQTAQLTQTTIRQQAATSVLSQANTQPALALRLLS